MHSPEAPLLINPFGEESCEHEIKILQEHYPEYYYNRGRFNRESLETETYLIVGRRGAGKTSLAKHFEFQQTIRNATSIIVNEPDHYEDIFRHITTRSSYLHEVVVARVAMLWDYILWSLIFSEMRATDRCIATADPCPQRTLSPSRRVATLLRQLQYSNDAGREGAISENVEDYLASDTFAAAREAVLHAARKQPIIIAIDTIERYDKNDDVMMKITAALIQCASRFNISYAWQGLHVKTFVSAEIFPHIKESAITNTTKHIRHPTYLHWRPRDLIHLICWRYHLYLEDHPEFVHAHTNSAKWDDFGSVLDSFWTPYFGEKLKNRRRVVERTFPYVLRHTQMRPRQLVVICNAIAREARRRELGTNFKQLDIPRIIEDAERQLADEVLNSYACIYPRVAEIVDALRQSPMMFSGNHLDRIASQTAFAWPAGEYSMDGFRRLVAELGIVGRVRSEDEHTGIVAADFEYALDDRLSLRSVDTCVVHPMFYSKLQIDVDRQIVVYPFPDHPEFDIGDGRWR